MSDVHRGKDFSDTTAPTDKPGVVPEKYQAVRLVPVQELERAEAERDYHKERDHLNRRLVWSARERAEKAERERDEAVALMEERDRWKARAMRPTAVAISELDERIEALQGRIAQLTKGVELGLRYADDDAWVPADIDRDVIDVLRNLLSHQGTDE